MQQSAPLLLGVSGVITPSSFLLEHLPKSIASARPYGPGLFPWNDTMNFTLIRAEYDEQTERAYVELRAPDDDGGESIVAAIFSYRTTATYSKHERKQDIVRKARYMLKRGALAT